jgi:hypothetical protein
MITTEMRVILEKRNALRESNPRGRFAQQNVMSRRLVLFSIVAKSIL